MPSTSRPNRKPHTRLKELRRICGFTQTVLAEKIGTSLATIVAVETGTLAMSEDLATRIMLVSGVDAASLRDGPKLASVDKKPAAFDEAAFRRLTPYGTTATPGKVISSYEGGRIDIADDELARLSRELEGELRGMVLFTGKRNQYYVFAYLFRKWCKEMSSAFHLEKAAEAITQEHPGKLVYETPEWAKSKPAPGPKAKGGRTRQAKG